ncbi:YkvA family protein, partial [Rhizobium ruizarguesonis]
DRHDEIGECCKQYAAHLRRRLRIDMIPDIFAVIGFSDDIAVLSAAFAMVRGHIRPGHYEAADRVLADRPEEAMKTI